MLLRSYEKPASRCTGDLCSLFLLLFDFFSFTQLCRGIQLSTDSSVQLCVRALVTSRPGQMPEAKILLRVFT